MEYNNIMHRNIDVMNQLHGFNVVIVCCSSFKQASFWQSRLEYGKGSIISSDCIVLAVEEDWPGGAGNALGTLYAFEKASLLAKELYSIDILADLIASKISIGLYHTAGKGTRLAPLPGAENNNKPGVKIPATILINNQMVPITILEGVVKQTGCYAKSRAGRLSVFWGDQVFIPTAPVEYTVTHHADILCSLGPMLTEAEWIQKGMEKYGLIAQNKSGNAAQVEKVSHSTAVSLLSCLGEIDSVGASLGSFSVSHHMLTALLEEFSTELIAKRGKFDSDPHLWMPMTLEKASYLQLMAQKGIDHQTSSDHFDRIARMLVAFNEKNRRNNVSLKLFGSVDVGQGVLWWDYGQLKLYHQNTLLLTKSSAEAAMMRLFFNVSSSKISHSTVTNTVVNDCSVLSSCVVHNNSANELGFIRNSTLSNVRCKYIEAENCVLINVTAERIIAKSGSIIYNYIHDDHESKDKVILEAKEKDVIVGIFDEEGRQLVVRSHLDIDGGKVWDDTILGNQDSFAAIHSNNMQACPTALQQIIGDAHDTLWTALTNP